MDWHDLRITDVVELMLHASQAEKPRDSFVVAGAVGRVDVAS